MSAGLVLDLGNTAQLAVSFPSTAVAADGGLAITSGGCISALSGVLVGDVVDLLPANAYCNLWVAGRSFGSGPLLIGVQTSDSTTSGTFTDPTSGLASLPGAFSSGGWLILGSGPATSTLLGTLGSGVSGQYLESGFMVAQAFQRTGRYARVVVGSGFYDGPLQAGFISALKTTGSGGGFSWSPSSGGGVNV